MSELIDFFSYAFFIRAIIAGVLIGAMLSWVSPYIVLRREIIFTHTISHFAFLGVVIALTLNLQVDMMVFLTCLLSGYLIDTIQRKALFKKDAILEILAQAGLSLSMVILSLSRGFKVDLWQFLFGDILAISNQDLFTLLILGFLAVILIGFFHQNFIQISLSTTLRQNIKHKNWLNLLFVSTISIIIGLSIKIVGILLVSAFIAIPANIAKIYAKTLKQTFIFSIFIGLTGVLFGLTLSALYDIPSGATIVTVLSFFWFFSAVLSFYMNK